MIQLKTGDVVLIRQNTFKIYNPITWVAEGIRIFCRTRYNHCGVIVKNWGVPVLNEAKAIGVVSTPVDIALNNKEVVIRRFRGLVDEKEFAIRANSYLGKTPYDFWSLFIVQPVFIVFGKWIGKSGKSADKKHNCSEYCYVTYHNSKAYKMSPKDLLIDKDFVTIYEGKF